jgi:subtilisin family serine protease
MKKLILFSGVLFSSTLAFSVIFSQAALAAESSKRFRERRPGHILFQLKQGMASPSDLSTNQVLKKLRIKRKIAVSPESQLNLAAFAENSRLRPYAEEQMVEQLMATGLVEFAEPDYLVYPAGSVPNDPLAYKQWHHTPLRTFDAWDVTKGSPNVMVTVCDSGVDEKHPDLRDNVIQPGFNTVDNSTRSSPVNLHGTAVAGLIASKANNGLGISGIAPGVRILPVRVSNSSSGSAYLSDLAECVRYGADRGAKVHNVSFTGSESQTMDAAARYARSKGSLLFMAAGNQGIDISSSNPGYPSFIRVGATTQSERLAAFSNYGNPIDLVAPGEFVYTTTLNGQYTSISGTSFSSPITAAVAALVYSVKPTFTPDEVTDILFKTADPIGDAYRFGNGRVNAADAVTYAKRRAAGK